MLFPKRYLYFIAWTISVLLFAEASAQDIRTFKAPDPSDRVITYWMWLNGNITKQGITKDLEAMKAAGVNGTLFFSVGILPRGPVNFMSADWWDAVGHAMKESDRLKMKFGIYNSDGWSMSGGPWISAEESMKVLVWADTVVQGGREIQMKLPQPPMNAIYHDVAVIAFPTVESDEPIITGKVVSSTLVSRPEAAMDGSKKSSVSFLKAKGDQLANIVLDLGRPTDLRRLVFDEIKSNPFLEGYATLEYSNDGKTYRDIPENFPLNLKAEGEIRQLTFTFPKVNARYFRLNISFEASTIKPVVITQNSIDIGEILLYSSPRMNLWEPKSGVTKRIRHERQQIFMKELNGQTNDVLPQGNIVSTDRQIDLTSKVGKDGQLNWTAPAGNWVIQRIGYSSTGRKVGPATQEGKGFECDKMDAKSVETHFNAYSGKLIDLSNKLLGRPVDYIQMESWEAGIQNWTKGFEAEFYKRNGYSIVPYLPVLAGGYVVNSYQESNKFLWDFRNTISNMIAENYWGTMYRSAKARGVTVSGEGSGMQHYLYDPMRYQEHLDIPMGEFWPNEIHARADVKNASSVAHTYGRKLSGAEAFTSGDTNLWSVTPYDLKQIGDEAFTLGLNHVVLHTYVHQPYDVGPGLTLAKFGNHLQRLNPWYVPAKGWFDYLARCQYMLRQGKDVQDIAYFTGEGIPSYLGLPWELTPALPKGFDYDGVNTAIIKRMVVRDGKLYLPSGASYHLLAFQDITQMTLELVNEIKRLVAAGATIYSAKPVESPSLSDNTAENKAVQDIAAELWGNIDGKMVKENSYGKGKVYYGLPLEQVMEKASVLPDIVFTANIPKPAINFVHKQTDSSDVYFLANHDKKPLQVKATFRIGERLPELWDLDKGTSSGLAYRVVNSQQIEVPLNFDPLGSAFVVFKRNVSGTQLAVASTKVNKENTLNGAWKVNFKSATDHFEKTFNNLVDWSANGDARVKYFSGSATYFQEIQLKKEENSIVEIDLGDVSKNMATVILNGKEVAHLWKPPYKADLTDFMKEGTNRLEIVVTNTASNGVIGDERFATDLSYGNNLISDVMPEWLRDPKQRASERKTFVTYKYLDKESSLDPSGMIGPVSIKMYK
jgi:hypothetical protein